MLGLSELAPRMLQSEIRAMSVACDAVGGVNLAQGVCDTEVPEVVAEAAQGAIRDGHYIYTRLDGISRWRRAIAEKVEASCLRAGDGSGVDPEGEVLVTSGCRERCTRRQWRCLTRGMRCCCLSRSTGTT